MKVLVVAALALLSACRLEAAAVKPQAGATGGSAEPRAEAALETLGQHLQTFSDYITKELPDRLQAEEMKQQAKAFLERAGQQFAPLATELQTGVLNLFSQLLEAGKRAAQKP
ncbi:apolipoprotein A-II-like [Rhea pennata]|uniref:apolipoprotein A-II-like n=1 Tax=Rhea pennata TaxID=8795 RepID=UPI002E269E5F